MADVVIFDAFGRPIDRADLHRAPEGEALGRHRIVDRYALRAATGLTPRKLAAILREAESGNVMRQAELFQSLMDRDGHITAEMGKRIAAVAGLPLEISPADDSAKAKEMAAFVEEVLEDISGKLAGATRHLLSAIGHGFADVEIVWQAEGKRFLPVDLVTVDHKRLTFINSLVPKLITDDDPAGAELIPFRHIYHTPLAISGHESKAGVFRPVTWAYLFKHTSIKDWAIFLEIYGIPVRIGKYPASASQEDIDRLKQAIRSLGVDGSGVISKEAEVEIVETAVKGTLPHEPMIKLMNAEISKAIVGQTLTAEVGDKGSYAASQTHNQVRQDLRDDDALALAETLRQQLVMPLVGFNFGWDAPIPKVDILLPMSAEEVTAETDKLKGAQDLGFPVTLEMVAERLQLPIPGKDENILTPARSAAAVKTQAAQLATHWAAKAAAESGAASPGHPMEGYIERAVSLAAEMGLTDPAAHSLAQAGGFDEFQARLAGLTGEAPPARLQALMAQALFLADLAGQAQEVD